MSTQFAEIMSRLINTPLMAHPRKAMTFYNVLSGKLGRAPVELPTTPDAIFIDQLATARPNASRFYGSHPESMDERGRAEPFRLTRGGTGVITINGSLVNRGAWIGANSGLVSYEGIKFQLDRAAADNRVRQIILDMHTPGGEAVGAFEAGDAVRRARDKKPVIAVGNGMAASAGYAMASQATKIINSPTGILGSIGVVMLHMDHSEMLANEGVKPTLIFAGAHKVDANPLEPLAESVKGELQAEVDRFYELFVQSVATGRGRRASAKAIRDTEARTYMGQDAVAARLADDIGTFEEVLADLDRRPARSSRTASAAATRSANMLNIVKAESIQDGNTDVVVAAEARSALDAARAEGEAAGRQAATVEARAAATARFRDILKAEGIKGREAVALDLATRSPDMSVEDVVGFCAGLPAAAPAVTSIAARAAETGAQQVGGADANGGAPQPPANPMLAAVDSVNARVKRTA